MKFIQRKLDAQLRSKWEEMNICCYSFLSVFLRDTSLVLNITNMQV